VEEAYGEVRSAFAALRRQQAAQPSSIAHSIKSQAARVAQRNIALERPLSLRAAAPFPVAV
jgi:hypothetical protein